MGTYVLTGSAVAVKKKIKLTKGDGANDGLSDATIQVGLSPTKLLPDEFTGFNAQDIANAWNSSSDVLIREVSAVVDGDGVVFSHNTAGSDFEIVALVNGGAEVLTSTGMTIQFNNNVTGGTFTLTFQGQTTGNITYNPASQSTTIANVLNALEALSNIQVGDVFITPDPDVTKLLVTFGGQYTGLALEVMSVDYSGLTGGNSTVSVATVQQGNLGTSEVQELAMPGYATVTQALNEIQQIDMGDTVQSGTFTLDIPTYGETPPIPFDAGRSLIRRAIESVVGVGNTIIKGGPLAHFEGNDVTAGDEITGSQINSGFANWILSGIVGFWDGTARCIAEGSVDGSTGAFGFQQWTLPLDATDFDNIADATLRLAVFTSHPPTGAGGTWQGRVGFTVNAGTASPWPTVWNGAGVPATNAHEAAFTGPNSTKIDFTVDSGDSFVDIDVKEAIKAVLSIPGWASGDHFTLCIDCGSGINQSLEIAATGSTLILHTVADSTPVYTYNPVTVQFIKDVGGVNIGPMVPSALATITTIQNGGTQTVPNITGGTFDLGFSRPDLSIKWVNGIPYNVSSAALATAINAVLGSGSVTCSGGSLPETPIEIDFAGGWANKAVNPTQYRLHLFGLLGGNVLTDVIRTAKVPSNTENVFDFIICPGRGTLGLNKTVNFDTAGNWGYFKFLIPGRGEVITDKFRFIDCTALDIENVINEMFGKDVCRVYQTTHSQEWFETGLGYGVATNYNAWYYRDVYRIVFHTDYANPNTFTSFTFELPGGTSITTMMFASQGADKDDAADESYRVVQMFYRAATEGTPLHDVRIIPSYIEGQQLTFRHKLIQRYVQGIYDEPGATTNATTPRAVTAEFPADMQVKLTWMRRFRSTTKEGDTVYDPEPLAATAALDWDAPALVFQHALETLANGFFGAGNVIVTGGLRNSWLSETAEVFDEADSYQDLRVTLTGRWNQLPLDEYEYWLDLSIMKGDSNGPFPKDTQPDDLQFNYPLPYTDIVQRPIPPLRSERQRLSIDSTNLTGTINIGFNNVFAPVTANTTAAQLEDILNGLSTLGEFTGTFQGENATVPYIPEKWCKSVTVYGLTVGTGPMEVEFNGYGFQWTDVPNVQYALSVDTTGILTITTITDGVAIQSEIQTVVISGSPWKGHFKLILGSDTTASFINYNADNATVQALLEALPGVGAGKVVCTGGPLPASIRCTFSNTLGNLAQMTVTGSTVANPTVSTAIGQEGGSGGSLVTQEITRGNGPNFWDSPDNWVETTEHTNRVPSSQDIAIIDDAANAIKYGLRQRAPFLVQTIGSGTTFIHGLRRRTFLSNMKVYVYAKDDGELPSGMTEGYYYTKSVASDGSFLFSETLGGDPIEVTNGGNGEFWMEVRELTLIVYARFAGNQLGLPNRRSSGDIEYLAKYLEMGFAGITLGQDNGNGLSLGRINTIDQPITNGIHIIQTGTGSDGNIPAVLFLMDNDTVDIQMDNGDVGIAVYSDETASLRKITQNAGTLMVSNATVADKITSLPGSVLVVKRSVVNGQLTID